MLLLVIDRVVFSAPVKWRELEERRKKSKGFTSLMGEADTLTAFETLKSNLSGLTSEADPNRKALDGLTASEIKKAAGPMCKTKPCRERVFLQ